MEGIPKATIYRVMKQYVGNKRLSDEAVDVVKQKVEEYIANLTRRAVLACNHAKRATIRKDDIILALQS